MTRTPKPRHADLAGQLAPLRDFLELEAQARDAVPAFIGEPANDNTPDFDPALADLDVERVLDIRPTIGEIMRAIRAEGGPASIERDDAGRIVRQGGLRFDRAGGLREYWTPGGWQRPREQLRGPKGVARPSPGLALAGRIASNPKARQVRGEDREEIEARRLFVEDVRGAMSTATARTLDALAGAGSLADIGRAHGLGGRTAQRRARDFLLSAAEEIGRIMRQLDEAA